MDIKVTRIRRHETGVLKAHFTAEVNGWWYRDCSYFNTGANEWMNFPQEMKPPLDGGVKPKYVPYCGLVDTSRAAQIKNGIIKVLKEEMANESNASRQPACEVQDDAFALPF